MGSVEVLEQSNAVYLFKNQLDLTHFIENIDENLKLGGLFIGTCFDGSLIWEKLKELYEANPTLFGILLFLDLAILYFIIQWLIN